MPTFGEIIADLISKQYVPPIPEVDPQDTYVFRATEFSTRIENGNQIIRCCMESDMPLWMQTSMVFKRVFMCSMSTEQVVHMSGCFVYWQVSRHLHIVDLCVDAFFVQDYAIRAEFAHAVKRLHERHNH